MKENDIIQRFIFEKANIRGEIIHLDATYQAIIKQHKYPQKIAGFLGEAMIACILLTGSIKFEGELTLQFNGDDRLPLLIVQCNNQMIIRAYAKYQENIIDEEYNQAFLSGKMVLTINQYNQKNAYQSVVPINSCSMSKNLTNYFINSEQILTHVWITTNENKAAGMLLQQIPGEETIENEKFWEYAVVVGQTLTEEELLNLDNETILHRLYHETEIRLFTSRKIRFGCKCNAEKMHQVLRILGKDDLQELLKEQGEVKINCEFCNKDYVFDSIDVAMLFINK